MILQILVSSGVIFAGAGGDGEVRSASDQGKGMGNNSGATYMSITCYTSI